MKSLDQFFTSVSEIDPELTCSLEDSLFRMTELLRSRAVPERKKSTMLKQLHLYLQKKCTELDPQLVEARDSDLRRIRNSLAHGRINPELDLTPLYAELWKAIGRLANRLGPFEIENLLAYTLVAPNVRAAARGVSGARIVAIYNQIFASLEPKLQRKVFSELLLSLFSDQESLSFLSSSVKK